MVLKHSLLLFFIAISIQSFSLNNSIDYRMVTMVHPMFQDQANGEENTSNEENSENEGEDNSKQLDTLKKEAKRFVRAFGMFFENTNDSIERVKIEDSLKKSNTLLKAKYYAINKRNFNTQDLDIMGDSIYLKQKPDKVVFGFHPHWSKKNQKNYNYRILTALAYFAYELDPVSGGYLDIYDWESSPVVDDALRAGVDVYLTVANFTSRSNRTFLNNLYAQQKSIDSIDALLNRRKAHGVVIDFENVPKDLDTSYTNYIKNLSERLKQSAKKIAIALPGNNTGAFQIEALNQYVDFFIVMGKNYFYKIGEPAGPVAPLNENKKYGKKGLRQSVGDYLLAKIPREKFILSLPYYGFEWETEADSLYSRSTALDRLTYDEIKDKYGDVEFKYDTLSQSAYYIYTTNEGKHMQVWFDDAKTLGKKFNLINAYDLAGTGIWALSFGSNDKELWQLLDYKFSGGWQAILPFEVGAEELTWMSIFRNLGFLKGVLVLGVIVLLLGFILSLRNSQIRAKLFQNTIIKNVVLFGLPLYISSMVYLYSETNKMIWAVVTFICMLIGFGLYFLLVRMERDLKNLNRIP